jgi:hypothetical protein
MAVGERSQFSCLISDRLPEFSITYIAVFKIANRVWKFCACVEPGTVSIWVDVAAGIHEPMRIRDDDRINTELPYPVTDSRQSVDGSFSAALVRSVEIAIRNSLSRNRVVRPDLPQFCYLMTDKCIGILLRSI